MAPSDDDSPSGNAHLQPIIDSAREFSSVCSNRAERPNLMAWGLGCRSARRPKWLTSRFLTRPVRNTASSSQRNSDVTREREESARRERINSPLRDASAARDRNKRIRYGPESSATRPLRRTSVVMLLLLLTRPSAIGHNRTLGRGALNGMREKMECGKSAVKTGRNGRLFYHRSNSPQLQNGWLQRKKG